MKAIKRMKGEALFFKSIFFIFSLTDFYGGSSSNLEAKLEHGAFQGIRRSCSGSVIVDFERWAGDVWNNGSDNWKSMKVLQLLLKQVLLLL